LFKFVWYVILHEVILLHISGLTATSVLSYFSTVDHNLYNGVGYT